MRNLRKYIAGVLCVCLLVTGITAVAETDTEPERAAAGEVLTALGLWDAAAVSDTVTRGEMADIIVRVMGAQDLAASMQEQIFADVPKEHPQFGQIGCLYDLGIISEAPQFYPQNPITYAEAVKLLLCAMGYQRYAEASGGYPTGYFRVATRQGLLPAGMEISLDSTLSKENVAFIVENALECSVMEPEQFGNKIVYSINTDNTLLSCYHGIYIQEDVLRNAGSKAMDTSVEVKNNQIRVGSRVMEADGMATESAEWLGYRVKAYYKDDNGLAELCYLQPYRNRVLELSEEASPDLENGTFSYEDDSGRTRQVNIPSSAALIYNDRGIYTLEEQMVQTAQRIVLIDNNNDGSYDVVRVFNYEVAVISGIDYSQKILYFKYPLADGTYSIGLESDDMRMATIQNTIAEEINVTAVQKNAVISILKDMDERVVQIIVSSDTVSGTVNRIEEQGDGTVIFVDQSAYRYSKNAEAQEYYGSLSPGMRYTFYLDHMGRIADAVLETAESLHYGFLVNAVAEGVFHNEIQLLMYLPDAGGLRQVKCAARVRIDGAVVRTAEEVLAALQTNSLGNSANKVVPKPVKYMQNAQGEISFLNTPHKGVNEQDEVVDFVCYTGFTSGTYNTETHVFGGQVRVDTKTKIFCVPLNEVDFTDRTKYVLKDFNYLRGRVYPSSAEKMEIFGISKDMTAEVIVLYQENTGGTEIDQNTPITVVSDIMQAINKDGELVTCIEGWEKGEKITVNASSDFDADLTKYYVGPDGDPIASKVRRGDIIRYKTNAAGEIEDYDKIFSLRDEDNPQYVLRGNEADQVGMPESHESLLAVSTGMHSANGYNCTRIFSHNNENNYIFGAQMVGYFGKIKERVDNDLIVTGSLSDGRIFQEFCDTSKMTILTLDEAEDEVYVSTVDEIKTIEDYGEEEASDVLFFSFSAKSSNLLIVKREK